MQPMSLEQAKQYKIQNMAANSSFSASLRDFQTYAAAGQKTMSFFQTPIGQADSSGHVRTINDTSMTLAGQLSKGVYFLVESVQVYFFPGGTITGEAGALAASNNANDVAAVAEDGWLEFKIGRRPVVEDGPLIRFPPATRLATSFAMAMYDTAIGQLTADYASTGGMIYKIQPLLIEPNEAFSVSIDWENGAVALPSGVAGKIGVVLGGMQWNPTS